MITDTLTIAPSEEISKLGIMHLKRYWQRAIAIKEGIAKPTDFTDEWLLDNTMLHALNLGLEQTITYLFNNATSFDAFEDWVLQVNNGNLSTEKLAQFNASVTNDIVNIAEPIEKVLSDEDIAFWDENGYLIIRNVIPAADCKAAIDAICDFISVDINNPDTWHTPSANRQGVMVQLFQHPALDKNRQSDKIRKVYEQLWNRKDIWLNTDRAGFNPPETARRPYQGIGLHWDVSLELPIPFGLQGILYLTDTKENQGALTLVPGFQHRIENWLNNLPENCDPRTEDMYALGAKPIAANAGDFIVWHHALPHGGSPNTADLPRIVQYVNYSPVNAVVNEKWK